MNQFDKLIFELSILSNIQINTKISTTNEFICIDYDTPLQPLYRWWYGDNRYKTMNKITNLIRTAIMVGNEIIENITNNSSKAKLEKINRLKTSLSSSKLGISNIINTYKYDYNVSAILTPLLHEIDEYIETIEKKIYRITYISISV